MIFYRRSPGKRLAKIKRTRRTTTCSLRLDNSTTSDTSALPPNTQSPTITMGGVSVKDVDAQKFINAYAAFLKRQGKLPMYVYPVVKLYTS